MTRHNNQIISLLSPFLGYAYPQRESEARHWQLSYRGTAWSCKIEHGRQEIFVRLIHFLRFLLWIRIIYVEISRLMRMTGSAEVSSWYFRKKIGLVYSTIVPKKLFNPEVILPAFHHFLTQLVQPRQSRSLRTWEVCDGTEIQAIDGSQYDICYPKGKGR